MNEFRIGNWYITEDTLEWRDSPEEKTTYFIDRDRLLESHDNTYSWLTHVPQKTWLTPLDVYQMNTAFIYAMEKFEVSFDKRSFIETIQLQQHIVNDKISRGN